LGIAAFVASVFWPVITLQGSLFFNDVTELHVPIRGFFGEAMARGELPLWCPDIYLGYPLFVEGQAGPLYPLNLLLFPFMPAWQAYGISFVLHLAIAGVALFAFLWRFYDRAPAVLGGVMYGLNGYFVMHHFHLNMVQALALTPVVLALFERLLEDGRPLTLALTALAMGCLALAGHPQATGSSYSPQTIEVVTGTHIFARLAGARLMLAYEMSFAAAGELAMVLPVPIVRASGDDALTFLDLSRYPALFDDLGALFEGYVSGDIATKPVAPSPLAVHHVGAFEASFVPSPADFGHLDPRFRLPPDVWSKLPGYGDYGFAVFKLRGKPRGVLDRLGLRRAATEPQRVHPMAFAFTTRWPDRVFFPTVHVHDGRVHSEAVFDHALYCQSAVPPRPARGGFIPAFVPVRERVAVARTEGLVDPERPCHQMRICGPFPNHNIVGELA